MENVSRYVVLAAAFGCRFILVAAMFNGALYLPIFQREFNVGAATTGWMGSLTIALLGFVGLPTGFALKRWSCRKVAVVGSLLSFTGVFLSFFATSIGYLMVTFSIIMGTGTGIAWATHIVVVETHFKDNFAVAFSLMGCGGNTGRIVFPPLIQYFVDTFGWRGGILLQSAVIFHAVAFSCLFRSTNQRRSFSSRKHVVDDDSLKFDKLEDSNLETPNGCDAEIFTMEVPRTNTLQSRTELSGGNTNELGLAQTKDVKSLKFIRLENEQPRVGDSSEADYSEKEITDVSITKIMNARTLDMNAMKPDMKARTPESLENATSFKPGSMKKLCFKYIPTLPVFIVVLTYTCHSYALIAVIIHLVAKAEDTGASSTQASLAVSLQGFGGIIGSVLNGAVMHYGWLSPFGVNITASCIICVVAFIASAVNGYVMLTIYAACIGCCVEGFLFRTAFILLKEVDSRSRFPVNVGFVLMMGGVADVSSGYVSGLIRDIAGSYQGAFYMVAGVFLVGFALTVILYFVHIRRRTRGCNAGKNGNMD